MSALTLQQACDLLATNPKSIILVMGTMNEDNLLLDIYRHTPGIVFWPYVEEGTPHVLQLNFYEVVAVLILREPSYNQEAWMRMCQLYRPASAPVPCVLRTQSLVVLARALSLVRTYLGKLPRAARPQRHQAVKPSKVAAPVQAKPVTLPPPKPGQPTIAEFMEQEAQMPKGRGGTNRELRRLRARAKDRDLVYSPQEYIQGYCEYRKAHTTPKEPKRKRSQPHPNHPPREISSWLDGIFEEFSDPCTDLDF